MMFKSIKNKFMVKIKPIFKIKNGKNIYVLVNSLEIWERSTKSVPELRAIQTSITDSTSYIVLYSII